MSMTITVVPRNFGESDTPATITEYAMSTMPLTPEYVASGTMRNLVDRKW